jgi:Transposase DDE domain
MNYTQNQLLQPITDILDDAGIPFSPHFAKALAALIVGKKISLHAICHLMAGGPSPEAKRQQLRRGLDHKMLTPLVWAKAIASLLPKGKWILALDRTNWKWGKTPINLLVLSVVCYGCAVPLLWVSLEKDGNSNTKERQDLLSQFAELFGEDKIGFLCADREFIGKEWFSWLLVNKISFRIRIHNDEYLKYKEDLPRHARELFRYKKCSCKKHPVLLWGHLVYVGGKYLYEEEHLIVISSEKGDLLADYKKRWKIETLFQALKGRGFHLESCRLIQKKRLENWFGFLALGFCWCLKMGYDREQKRQIAENKSPVLKNTGRRSESVFTLGFRFLQKNLACLCGDFSPDEFFEAISCLGNFQVSISLGKIW